MNFNMVKKQLEKFKSVLYICKTIELITVLTLQFFKNKILSSLKIIKLFFCYFKEFYRYNYLTNKHLLIPFFSDKSCTGIINNTLWSTLKELFVLLLYNNIVVYMIGTSLTFKKKTLLTSYTDYVISNLYNLSSETVTFYSSFILFKEFIFLEYDYFYFFFNQYVTIFYQVVNYYLLRSLNEFIILFFDNISIIYNVYFFIVIMLLLDIMEFNMYSELGSRANSMSNSIQNSKENVKYFTFVFNRFRQARITNEIIEIISSTNI